MASTLALRRLLSSNLAPNSLSSSILRPTSAIRSSASRLFNTNALRSSDDDRDESDLDDLESRSSRPLSRGRSRRPPSRGLEDFFSELFVPFTASRNLGHVLNLKDQISENPVLSATTRGAGVGLRRGWARETEEALHFLFDMPGFGKEDVKVSVERNTLSIKGEGCKDGGLGEEEPPRRFSTRIELPDKVFKTDGIKAEMKNGVLKVVVPKVKEEERGDVFHVKVD